MIHPETSEFKVSKMSLAQVVRILQMKETENANDKNMARKMEVLGDLFSVKGTKLCNSHPHICLFFTLLLSLLPLHPLTPTTIHTISLHPIILPPCIPRTHQGRNMKHGNCEGGFEKQKNMNSQQITVTSLAKIEICFPSRSLIFDDQKVR
jgi:hypothetical protein